MPKSAHPSVPCVALCPLWLRFSQVLTQNLVVVQFSPFHDGVILSEPFFRRSEEPALSEVEGISCLTGPVREPYCTHYPESPRVHTLPIPV
jgi:hypothetical protein